MPEQQTESVSPNDGVPTPTFHGLRPGQFVTPRYEIVRPLGSGGFAEVYEAFDRTLSRRVAIKFLRDDRISPTALRRFRREVALAQTVTSPHVVRVFDIGENGSQTFLTMELVEGETLRDRLARGPLALTEALNIAESVLKALEELHAVGIIHRDIKPSNVLLDADGHVKLADLGLARALTSNETRATLADGILGTFEYICPEQALGKDSDERSDLYSFGVMLFECLTGALPFGERSSVAAVLAHVNERPPSARKLRPEVPRWLAKIVARLLEKSPARRLRSATAVLAALEEERAPIDFVRLAGRAAMVVLAVGALATLWVWPQRQISRIVAIENGIAAVDSRNERLWSREDVEASSATLITLPGGRRAVAALPGPPGYLPRAGREVLLILDGRTGGVIERHAVPSFAVEFSEFADEYSRHSVVSTDVDHNGVSEVVITYVHVYYPSITLLYDSALNTVRPILFGSGHHYYAGSTDVNGDGRDELLFVGINNRMGWHAALAAIDVLRPTGAALGTGIRTPDSATRVASGGGSMLAWYELLPPGLPAAFVLPDKRQINLRYGDGRTVNLDFDGFRVGTKGDADARRQELRRGAYTALQTANVMTTRGDDADAVRESRRAWELATNAGAPSLAEWALRLHAKAMIAAGMFSDAETSFAELVSTSDRASDIAFDAGQQYHLAGRTDDAVRWYRKAYLDGGDHTVGRLLYESFEGALLALCEAGRFDDAEQAITEYARVNGEEIFDYHNLVDWHRGTLESFVTESRVSDTDLRRYWRLEFAYATRSDTSSLLQQVEAEEQRNGLHGGLVQSLKAQLLHDAGRTAEARVAIHASREWYDRVAGSDVTARAHATLIEARLRTIEATARIARASRSTGSPPLPVARQELPRPVARPTAQRTELQTRR